MLKEERWGVIQDVQLFDRLDAHGAAPIVHVKVIHPRAGQTSALLQVHTRGHAPFYPIKCYPQDVTAMLRILMSEGQWQERSSL